MSMRTYSSAVNRQKTHQSQPLRGREAEMVENEAGGYVFALDDWKRLHRFLILGSEGGTYYAGERELTLENAACVERCIKADGLRTVATILAVSDEGRAPRNDPAIFALMLAMKKGDERTRRAAQAAFSGVVRIGTHLFQAAEMVKALGGWGRGTHRAFSNWYMQRNNDDLAYQLVKYWQREGWSHRDILRKVRPRPGDKSALFRWAVGKPVELRDVPAIIPAFEQAKNASVRELAMLIREHNLPREAIPTEQLNSPDIWEALLEKMPLTAAIRNLGKMTSLGLLKEGSEQSRHVVAMLSNTEALRRARVHPMAILLALKTYVQGHGQKGKLSWSPVRQVVDALDDAFYGSFQAVESSGKRLMLALDVSGSMHGGSVAGTTLTPAQAAVAMALVALNTEPDCALFGFGSSGGRFGYLQSDPKGFQALPISKKDRIDQAVEKIRHINMGGTDCSLPMTHAATHRMKFDCFQIYTDSETWAGDIHPSQALTGYRQLSGLPAKLAVIAMTSNGFSIADPADSGMLDVVGFDTATPAILSDFARG